MQNTLCGVVVGLCLTLGPALASAQEAGLTFQGSLSEGGSSADGVYDMDFGLWDSAAGGAQVGSTVSLLNVPVSGGLFSVELDFGADAFDNTARWLEVTVEGSVLSPRQPITRAPYAIQTRGILVDENEHVGIGVTPGERKLRVWNLEGAAFEAFGTTGRAIEGITTEADMAILGSNQDPDGIGVFGQNQPTGNWGYLGSPAYGVLGKAPDLNNHWAGYFEGRGYFSGTTLIGRSQPITSSEVFGIHGPSQSGYNGMYVSTAGEAGWPFYGYAAGQTGDMWHYYDGSTGKWHLYNGGIRMTVDNQGQVGIGEASPNARLHVTHPGGLGERALLASIGEGSDTRAIEGRATSTTTGVGVYGAADGLLGTGVLGTAGAASGATTGVWGIAQSGSGRGVLGRATATSGVNYGVYGISDSASGYDFFAGGVGINYGSGSSRRWKANVVEITDPLGKLSSLRGVYFDWDAQHGGRHDIGMIAEEVGEVVPEIVAYEENGVDAHGMDYSKLTPLLVEAMKELRAEKDAENAALRARVEQLEALVAAMLKEGRE